MIMRNRRLIAGGGLLLLLALSLRHPTANIEILTHDAADRTPHRVAAALDVGIMAVSFLVTWTGKRFV